MLLGYPRPPPVRLQVGASQESRTGKAYQNRSSKEGPVDGARSSGAVPLSGYNEAGPPSMEERGTGCCPRGEGTADAAPLGRAAGKGRVPSPCSHLAVSYGLSLTAAGQGSGTHGAASQLQNAQRKGKFIAGGEKLDLWHRDPRSSTQRGRLLLWTRPRRHPVRAQSLTVSPFPWDANRPRRLGG